MSAAFSACTSDFCAVNEGTRAVRVVFRYDDSSTKSSLDLERALLQAFANVGLQVTLGVIPFVCARDCADPSPQDLLALSPEKVQLLRGAAAEGHIEVALHGYSHQA